MLYVMPRAAKELTSLTSLLDLNKNKSLVSKSKGKDSSPPSVISCSLAHFLTYPSLQSFIVPLITVAFVAGASGGQVRISCSGEPKAPGAASTIAEEAVDQLQENEKLVAGNIQISRSCFTCNYLNTWSFRAERDLGGEAAPHRVHPAPARGRLCRDGRRYEGGRADGRVLQSQKGIMSDVSGTSSLVTRLQGGWYVGRRFSKTIFARS